MPLLIHEFVARQCEVDADRTALLYRDESLSYRVLWDAVQAAASGLRALGLQPGDRVAVALPKQPRTVIGLLAAAAAGGAFVPVNPLLKPRQVSYILRHCNVRVLITSRQRLTQLREALGDCPDLLRVVLVEDEVEPGGAVPVIGWRDFTAVDALPGHRRIDTDMAAILYTSGSTGKPKGVVLSHRNLVAGAESVASYLRNTADDRMLAVLPLSFDAGLSQLTTAFSVGASAVLLDYLLPRDVIRAVVKYGVTGLAAVPPLWNQLVCLEWPAEAVTSLRYITNTGGAMPRATTRALREALPQTDVYLMYGLTEAFRSTFLPPSEVDDRPESIGKAIPHAEIHVVNEAGRECAPGEPGELVHRGALVAMGYWNDPETTAERFRPAPGRPAGLPLPEMAVWSGDQVIRDEQGYLYFVSRKDDMIKTSGYRVSPTEVEEVAYDSGAVAAAAAIGLPHAALGQAILLLVVPRDGEEQTVDAVLNHCRRELPNFMVPASVLLRDSFPHNQNGKIDRRALQAQYQSYFEDASR